MMMIKAIPKDEGCKELRIVEEKDLYIQVHLGITVNEYLRFFPTVLSFILS